MSVGKSFHQLHSSYSLIMKTASLSGSLREGVGKKDARQLRQDSRVPGVMYGAGEQRHFSVLELELSQLVVNSEVFLIAFELDGKSYDCIIQDVQFHPVTDRIIHLDLLQTIEGKPIRTELPLRTTGVALGVINGGRVQMLFRRVPVLGLAADLPDEIVIDISDLDIGDNARVRDLNISSFELLLSDSALLVAVKRTRAAMSADSEEGEEEGGESADTETTEGQEAAPEA